MSCKKCKANRCNGCYDDMCEDYKEPIIIPEVD